jgi:hypothetical protein
MHAICTLYARESQTANPEKPALTSALYPPHEAEKYLSIPREFTGCCMIVNATPHRAMLLH